MSDLIENGEPTAVIVGANPYNTYGLATQGFVWAAISSVSGNFDGRVKSVNEIEPDSTGNVNVTSIRTEDYSGDVNEVRANLTALSGNVEYRILTNVDYKELHDYTDSSIEALSGDSSEKFEVLMAASGGWDDTQHKMESSSGDWDNATSKVESASADWDSVYASVEATSGDWDSAYSAVENTSGDWDSVYSSVNGASGDWDNATSKVESSSADWDSAYSAVENTSGDWDSVYSSVNGVSGDWNDATSKVESSSGNWDSVYSSVNGASGDWDSVYNTVNTVSSNYYTIEETDKAIDRLAAYYITCDAEGHAFDHLSSLLDAEILYSGGRPRVPTRNDYAVVLSDESNGNAEWRYIFATAETTSTTGQWEAQYPIESNEYQALSNKPKINGVELIGDKSGTAFGLRNLTNLAYGDGDSLALTSDLESVSSDMYSVYTTVQNASSDWSSAYSSMNGASGYWDSVYNEFSSMSADIAQKCIPAVSGNLATLGADGDIEDSGKAASFFGLYCEADAEAAEDIFSATPVSGEDFTSDDLVDGTRAYVNFAKGCNVDSPKLKIGTSDACPIYRYGTTAALKNAWVDNQTVEFIFNSDNSAWYMLTPAVGGSDVYGVLKTSPKITIISNVSYSDNSRAVTPSAMSEFLSAAMSTPEFNEETAYAKDALVVYKPDGSSTAVLYVFTKAHAAGPWKGDSAATGDVRRVADYHVDSTPTADSSNSVTSDGVYKALSQRLKQSFAAPSFDTTSAYAAGDRATYLGDPYEFTSPKTTGDWNDNIVKKLTIADFMSTDSMPMSMLADEFDDSAVYDAGEYVLYDSKLYRVIRPHGPEEGFNNDFELVPTLGEDLYLTYYTALDALVRTDNILHTNKVGIITTSGATWPKDHIPAFSNTNATSKPVLLKDSGYTTSDFAAASAIASLFSPLSTYSVNDVVMHNCGMYVCSADVDEPHDWTGSANWMSVTVKDAITAIGNLVGNKADKVTGSNLNDIYAMLDGNGNLKSSGKKDINFVHTSGNETIDGHKTFYGNAAKVSIGNRASDSGEGLFSLANGRNATASGKYSHSEGNETTASAESSHSEGNATMASGLYSHAEGDRSIASGVSSHAEGYMAEAASAGAHAEGDNTIASGKRSHSEGNGTTANSTFSHAEGLSTAIIDFTVSKESIIRHPEWAAKKSYKIGDIVTVEESLYRCIANHTSLTSWDSTEELNWSATNSFSGRFPPWTPNTIYAVGNMATYDNALYSCTSAHTSEADWNSVESLTWTEVASSFTGSYSHSEGEQTIVLGEKSHAEGYYSVAAGIMSHAEGYRAVTAGEGSASYSKFVDKLETSIKNPHRAAFAWQGQRSNATRPWYHSHGDGTFNINPVPEYRSNDPASGFYIGEESLASRLSISKISWSELKALRDEGKLVSGKQYRITDYVATTNGDMSSRSANYPFDIIVVANNENTLNENARAVMHEDVLPFDTDRKFLEDDYCTYGGAVYRLLASYDGIFDATMEYVVDALVSYKSGGVYRYYKLTAGHTAGTTWSNTQKTEVQLVGEILFAESPYFYGCDLAAWGVWYCLDNDANRFAWADTVNGRGVIYRLIDEWRNDCPYDFKGIQFRPYGDVTDTAWRYTFDSGDESDNTDYSLNGGANNRCVFGNIISTYNDNGKVKLNRIVFKGYNCHSNTFGNNCHSNTFGSNCCSNTFGYDNTLSYYRYITFENGVSFVRLNCTANRDGGVYYQNITVASGVSGTLAEPKLIADPNCGQNYKTTYQPANSQVISV